MTAPHLAPAISIVNSIDLNLLLAVWGTDACDYDIDGTGVIGMVDLLTLLRNWGSCTGECGATSSPAQPYHQCLNCS